MEQTISIDTLIQLAVVIAAIWGFFKVIMEIVKAINARHDKEQEWDKTKEDLEKGRQELITRFDKKLADMEKTIEDNHCDTEAKIQELKADMLILTRSISAILDGLKQQGCNGAVTKAKEDLDQFLIGKAYD